MPCFPFPAILLLSLLSILQGVRARRELLNLGREKNSRMLLEKQVEEMRRLERRLLPADIDYVNLHGLRLEARQKLDQIRPANLGQASRISGVSPADIAALMVYLEKEKL